MDLPGQRQVEESRGKLRVRHHSSLALVLVLIVVCGLLILDMFFFLFQ